MSRFTHSEMEHELGKILWSREQWLLDHSSKRPAHEVEAKQRGAAVLRQAVDDYARAAAREREKSA